MDWFNDKPFEGKGNTIQVSVAERKVLMAMSRCTARAAAALRDDDGFVVVVLLLRLKCP